MKKLDVLVKDIGLEAWEVVEQGVRLYVTVLLILAGLL